MDTVKNRGGRRPSAIAADPKVGERLRFLRIQQGLSQAELAEGICTTALVSHLETGRSGTTVETLKKFADRLNVPLYEIFREPQGDYPYTTKLELVEAYILRGEFEPAQEFLDYLAGRDDLVVVEHQKLVLLQGTLFNKNGRPKAAIEVLLQLIDQIEQVQNADNELTCKLYTQLGNSHYHLRDFTKAYAAYKRAYQVSLRLSDFELTSAIAAYNLGMICTELQIGDEATLYLEQAQQFYESVSDLRSLADAYFYSALAKKEEAYISKALSLYESLDAINMVKLVRQHHALYVEAERNRPKAISELIDLSGEFERLGDLEMSVYALSKSAILCLEDGEHEQATQLLQTAATYNERIDHDYLRRIDFLLANSLFCKHVGNYNDCIAYAEQASELCQRMGLFVEGAECLQIVAEAYHSKNQHEVAYQVLKRSIDLGKQRGVSR